MIEDLAHALSGLVPLGVLGLVAFGGVDRPVRPPAAARRGRPGRRPAGALPLSVGGEMLLETGTVVDRSVYAVQSAAMRVLAHEQDLNPTYHDAVDEPKRLWGIPDAATRPGSTRTPRAYERRILGFFDAALRHAS
ncbi:hypothetical protein [Aeromicrobium sp.]|uniref:hypothetical protein n=1 Tax=Aeromicrobium sp. TaxID=1871063 RepID=UPI00262541DA|nr:hypothetical protein [Aeromicrobium sp.]